MTAPDLPPRDPSIARYVPLDGSRRFMRSLRRIGFTEGEPGPGSFATLRRRDGEWMVLRRCRVDWLICLSTLEWALVDMHLEEAAEGVTR